MKSSISPAGSLMRTTSVWDVPLIMYFDEILDLVCWSHDEVHVDLECVIDHVLDEILAYWFISDGVAHLMRSSRTGSSLMV